MNTQTTKTQFAPTYPLLACDLDDHRGDKVFAGDTLALDEFELVTGELVTDLVVEITQLPEPATWDCPGCGVDFEVLSGTLHWYDDATDTDKARPLTEEECCDFASLDVVVAMVEGW